MNRKSSIQRQLQLLFVLALVFVELIMGGVWITYNQMLLKKEAEHVLIVEADMMGAAARPALMFEDKRMAAELLQDMSLDSGVLAIKLFTFDGKSLYARGGADAENVLFQAGESMDSRDGVISTYRIIRHKKRTVGVIYLASNLDHLEESQITSIITVVTAMLMSLVLGLLFAFRVQQRVASPIKKIATLMQRIAEEEDYSLRMDLKTYNSETQALQSGLNHMTEKIEHGFDIIEANQHELEKSEYRFRTIVEMAPVPVVIGIPAEGVIRFYNQAAADLFDIKQDDEISLQAINFYRFKDDQKRIHEKLAKLGSFSGEEVEMVTPGGRGLWLSISMSLIKFENEMSTFSSFVDITKQKQVEEILERNNLALEQRVFDRTEQLQLAKDQLQSTLDDMLDTYYRLNLNGMVTWASASVETLLGYKPQDVVGMDIKALLMDENSFGQLTDLLTKQSGEALSNQNLQLKHKSGKRVWVSLTAQLIKNSDGERVGYEGIMRNITQLVEADEQRQEMERKMNHVQRLESLGVLAGGIAHDFNNILASIMGNAELAGMKAQQGEFVTRELETIVAGSTRAADLCRQMLAYSGQGSFLKEDVNLTSLVEGSLQLIDVSIPKHVSLSLELAENLPAVYADKTQLEQIIMNLVTNAAESMSDKKAGEMNISTKMLMADKKMLKSNVIENELEQGAYILLEVSDTGCGMSVATRDKIFDPFFTTKFTGRGLGMSAVLGIVRAHGGTIQLESSVGRGSCFKVLLPVSKSVEIALLPAKLPTSEALFADYTVLVVDDELMVRSVVQCLLEKLGCSVLVAEGGKEAIELFGRSEAKIDMVLLDLTMPKMDGGEVLIALRKLNAEVPVYISSGYSREGIIDQFGVVQPTGFLQKPYSMKSLQRVLASVLEPRES
ncbi:MAG: PAS domain S-box protein [Mariprofundus sp.]|nr:PAS domain S-box protein [Mariprofundus sp.]